MAIEFSEQQIEYIASMLMAHNVTSKMLYEYAIDVRAGGGNEALEQALSIGDLARAISRINMRHTSDDIKNHTDAIDKAIARLKEAMDNYKEMAEAMEKFKEILQDISATMDG